MSSAIALLGLAGILGYAAVQRAGVPLNEWNLSLTAIGIVCGLYFLFIRERAEEKTDRIAIGLALAFIGFATFQLAPLPVAFVRWLSPGRTELLDAATSFYAVNPGYVTITSVPGATAEYVVTFFGYFLVFLTIRKIGFHFRSQMWIVAWPLLAISGLEALLGLYQVTLEGGQGIALGTYENRDHFCGLLEMALPFAVMYAVCIVARDRKRFTSPAGAAIKACFLLGLAACILISIIDSLSRMGFIVALITLFVAGLLTFNTESSLEPHQFTARGWGSRLAIAAIVIAVVLGFVFLPTDALISRFSDIAKTDAISADDRAQIWRDSVGLLKMYPVTGCGLGSYESCFYKFKTAAPMFTVNYAHNDYLQVLTELGIVGFLIGLSLILRVIQSGVKAILHPGSVEHRYLSIACLASIGGILLHSLVDFNMYVPANGLAFAWVLGLASINPREMGAPSSSDSRRRGPTRSDRALCKESPSGRMERFT